jgi:hypothetical protein
VAAADRKGSDRKFSREENGYKFGKVENEWKTAAWNEAE